MSMLAGMLHLNGAPVTQEDMAPMLAALSAKPHDRTQVWQEGPVGLAWFSLEISSEDAVDRQPLLDSATSIRMLFDGRLDNRDELGEALGLDYEAARQRPDSYFALQAYLKWGRECCRQLLGDFAFVVWDPEAQALSLFRDQIGIRPLYFAKTTEYFAFASDITSLRELPGVDTGLDELWAGEFLSYCHLDGSLTACKGIKRALPAHSLVVRPDGQTCCQRYWRLREDVRRISCARDEDYYAEFRQVLNQAVAARLRGTGPVASMLSGGLDSASITAMAAELLAPADRRLVAVSSVLASGHIGVEEDETEYIQAFLEKYPGILWSGISPAAGEDVFARLDEMFSTHGQPSKDMFHFMTQALLKSSASAGARTVLNGFDGDSFASAHLNNAVLEMLLSGRVVRAWQTCRQEAATQSLSLRTVLRRAFIGAFKRNLLFSMPGWLLQRLGKGPQPPPFLTQAFVQRHGLRGRQQDYFRKANPGFFQTIRDEEESLTLGGLQEVFATCASQGQALGLQLVFPLMDRRVIAHAVSLPLHIRRGGGFWRSPLREACRPILPRAIADRTGKGAFLPDYTRRNYQALTRLLPEYESGGQRKLPDFICNDAMESAAQKAKRSASGWDQDVATSTNVIMPLLLAEYINRDSASKTKNPR